ncbi:MAG: class IV adenylate cyclase [Bacteroidota bacterium]
MQELEVKILEVNQSQLTQQLLDLGAHKSFAGELRAVFYDFEDRRISQQGQLLRLRQEGEAIRLTHKSPISTERVKNMEEWETGVADWEATQTILAKLGLSPTKETHKIRTQYDWNGVHIVFDEYKGELAAIPVFIEIEAPTEEALFQTVEALGYQRSDCLSWNTYDLAKHYGLLD